jgi:hypothetical protein
MVEFVAICPAALAISSARIRASARDLVGVSPGAVAVLLGVPGKSAPLSPARRPSPRRRCGEDRRRCLGVADYLVGRRARVRADLVAWWWALATCSSAVRWARVSTWSACEWPRDRAGCWSASVDSSTGEAPPSRPLTRTFIPLSVIG